MRAFVAPALALGLMACQVSLPEGQILCGTNGECPEGWGCDNARVCRPEGVDAGEDAPRDDALEPDVSEGEDAGPIDIGPRPDVPGRDTNGPNDAGPGDVPDALDAASPPSSAAMLISSDVPISVDAVLVDGSSVFVAGYAEAGELWVGDMSRESPAGFWIARLDYDGTMLASAWLVRVVAEGRITSLARAPGSGRLVVGGRFTSIGDPIAMVSSPEAGFVLSLTDAGMGLELLGTFAVDDGPTAVLAMDADANHLCVTGERGRGASTGSFIIRGVNPGGFFACFMGAALVSTSPSGGAHLDGYPGRDVSLGATSYLAWTMDGNELPESVAHVVEPGTSRLDPGGLRAQWRGAQLGLFVDQVETQSVLVGSDTSGYGIAFDLGVFAGMMEPTVQWDGRIDGDPLQIIVRDMAVTQGSVVHVVGHYTGSLPPLPTATATRGFHVVFDESGRMNGERYGGASTIDAVATLGEEVVFAGTFGAGMRYPAQLDNARTYGAYVVVREP